MCLGVLYIFCEINQEKIKLKNERGQLTKWKAMIKSKLNPMVENKWKRQDLRPPFRVVKSQSTFGKEAKQNGIQYLLDGLVGLKNTN